MFFLVDAINGKNGWEDYKKNLFNKGLEGIGSTVVCRNYKDTLIK
jgi:hypothetical protein